VKVSWPNKWQEKMNEWKKERKEGEIWEREKNMSMRKLNSPVL
jgi:hypothetical protein